MAKQPATGETTSSISESASSPRPIAAAISDRVLWAVLDAAPDGLLIVDEVGAMLLANRRLEELFGYERGDLYGRPVETLLPDHARGQHLEHRMAFAARPRVRSMGDGRHLLGRRRDGSEFPVDISLSPLTTQTRQWVIAAVRDATQRQASEDRRRQIALLNEEDRMARELGETVIRSLYGAGLRLQSLRSRAPAHLHEDVDSIVAGLDGSIREIRGAIFGAASALTAAPDGDAPQ